MKSRVRIPSEPLKKKMEYILIFYLPFYPIHFFLIANFSNREEGSIIKSMGGANPDSTNGIKNRVLFN